MGWKQPVCRAFSLWRNVPCTMRYAISFPMIQTTAAHTASGPIGDSNTPYWKLRRRVGPEQ